MEPSFGDKVEEVIYPKGVPGGEKALREWLKERGVTWCCRKGKKPESPNQDSFSALVIEDQFALYGVFDGHGPNGHDVSDLARKVIVQKFLAHPLRDEDTEKAFHESFTFTQHYLETAKDLVDCMTSGTTCTLVYHRLVQKIMTIAHVGDSRSILVKNKASSELQVQELTIDHKPDLKEERYRIEHANPPGRVVFDGYFNHRVFAQAGNYPGLNMSRALGDVIAHKEAGLTAMPDIRTVDIAAEQAGGYTDLWLLVCTDGVWEFIENKEAANLSFKPPPSGMSHVEVLAKESWDRWMKDSDNEISDDITAVMIRL